MAHHHVDLQRTAGAMGLDLHANADVQAAGEGHVTAAEVGGRLRKCRGGEDAPAGHAGDHPAHSVAGRAVEVDAAPRIAEAIGLASLRRDCDVLIVCRGGGSIEDLWAYNEEAVARAIRASGHPRLV